MWDLSPRSAGRAANGSARGSRRLSARRVVTVGLSLGAVVATGAVAQASAHGGGFLGMGHNTAMHAKPTAQTGGMRTAENGGMSLATGMRGDDLTRMAMCTGTRRLGTMADQWMNWVGSGQLSMTSDQMSSGQMKPGQMKPGQMKTGDADDRAMQTQMQMQDRKAWPTMFGQQWWSHGLMIKSFANRMDPTFNQLLGINDTGVIVGYYGSGADDMHPNKGYLVRAPYRQRDVVSRNVPGSRQTQEIGINNSGVQVGFSIDKGGVTSGFVRVGERVRLVHNPLSTARPAVDQLLGINNHGIAAGFYNDAKGASHGYLYNICNGSFTGVHIPVAHDSLQATGINDLGVISGFYVTGKATHGFVLDHGRFKTIDLGNHKMTQALGLDDAGDVVGSFVDNRGATHGFVWQRGRLRTVDVPHATGGTVVNGLNNRGQLVGFYTTGGKRTIGFVAS